MSIWRVQSIIKHQTGTWPTLDPFFYTPTTIVLSYLEISCASIVASVPVFWPVLLWHISRMAGAGAAMADGQAAGVRLASTSTSTMTTTTTKGTAAAAGCGGGGESVAGAADAGQDHDPRGGGKPAAAAGRSPRVQEQLGERAERGLARRLYGEHHESSDGAGAARSAGTQPEGLRPPQALFFFFLLAQASSPDAGGWHALKEQ